MLKVKVTENYVGVKITGSYDDLNYLYDCFSYFTDNYESKSEKEEMVKTYILGLLYDIRHAYQGDREVIEDKECNYYSFNAVIPELIVNMVFLKNILINKYKKEITEYNTELNYIKYFYSLVLDSLSEFITPIRLNKIRKSILNADVEKEIDCPRWFEKIVVLYLNLSKKKRMEELVYITNTICNYSSNSSYIRTYYAMLEFLEENGGYYSNITCCDYPETIDW